MNRQDGGTWRDWRDHWLPGYLATDPQAIAAITVTPPTASPGLLTIRDQTLILPGTGIFDLSQYQLTTLANALTAVGWTATVNPALPGTINAAALLDTGESAASPVPLQDARQYPYLVIAGTATYALLRPLARQWHDRWQDIVLLGLSELEGPWLDALGTYLQIPRIGGEPDNLYAMRLYGMAVITSPNGLSMETFFAALGYAISITDVAPGAFTAIAQWPTVAPAGFVYTQDQLASMIDTLKAVGVLMTVIFVSELADTLTVTDDTVTDYAITNIPALWGGSLGLSLGVVGIVGPQTNTFIAVAGQPPHS